MSITQATTENFEELSKQEGTLIEFMAPWCGYCKRLGPVLKQIAQEYPNLTIAQVNIDEEEKLAQRYEVETIPSLFVFHEGKASEALIAPQAKDQLVAWLKQQKAID